MIATVRCPECQRLLSINGRGECYCGAYLIHHVARGRQVPVLQPDDTWVMDDKAHGWRPFQEWRKENAVRP